MSITTPSGLEEIVGRLADRSNRNRREATIQSDIRMLLLAAELNIVDGDIRDVPLESPVGEGGRIDVDMGACIIEVKKNLSVSRVADAAVKQLYGYVADRTSALGQRYVGVLTDGVIWKLYHLAGDRLAEVSVHEVQPGPGAAEALIEWISGVLVTEEKVPVTPETISTRLGFKSSGHALEFADLRAVYDTNRDRPEVQIKRELWASLLSTALGNQFPVDNDDLFVEHTYLVVIAECVAHAALRLVDLKKASPADLIGGDLFVLESRITGVVEHDFFDWPIECGDDGWRWVSAVARRIAQFDWSKVQHDVMKTIYESVIDQAVRVQLGEYYTPDFLAELMVHDTIDRPLEQRVLDPSCGSGTFLFYAVQRYLDAADAAGMPNGDAVQGVVDHVVGVDVHPVATTLARVTYLLAIGADRLGRPDRRPLRIPVYLGDSLQWGQRQDLFSSEMLTVTPKEGAQQYIDELKFPMSLLENADTFDDLVGDMADAATTREPGSKWEPFDTVARDHGLAGDDLATVEATYTALCRLHDARKDHIWSYFVRNLARPAWLSRSENRVDVLVGNPPWLTYRRMTAQMQKTFRTMEIERRFWSGGSVATQQDLSDLFVARASEQYLKVGGRFSFVMPAGVLSRNQYEGFRTGDWTAPGGSEPNIVRFDPAWDMSAVSPYYFPRTSAVVHGTKGVEHQALPVTVERWSGHIPSLSAPWSQVAPHLTRVMGSRVDAGSMPESAYRQRFANGATIFPRVLTTVVEVEAPHLGTGAGRVAVLSSRGKYENPPWKSLSPLDGVVERQFVHPLLLGESVLPFRQQSARLSILPLQHGRLVDTDLSTYPGMKNWWTHAERLWTEHRKSNLSLADNLDYRHKLTEQFPLSARRVVYTASGMHVAACRVTDIEAIVEHQLYWAAVTSDEEGLYLCAVLNSAEVTRAVEPLMVSGKGGGRHIDTYIWRVPIPLFEAKNPLHLQLVDLGRRGEEIAAAIDLPDMDHGVLRRRIRRAILEDGLGAALDSAVVRLLDPAK